MQRYGNKQLLISTHIYQLLSRKPILNLHDVKKLGETFDKIESKVRNLKTLNVDPEQFGPVSVSIIMSKLPNEIRLLISRAMPLNREWEVEIVMNHFQRESESREMCRFLANTNLETRDQRYQQNTRIQHFLHGHLLTNGKLVVQTAQSIIFNNINRKSKNARVLFDNGAQKSFINKKLSDTLGLLSVQKDRKLLKGFESNNEVFRELDIVQAELTDIHGENPTLLELIVVPNICSPLSNQTIELNQATHSHLITLPLADN